MKSCSALIFDCDGVLFDSRRSNIHYYNHLLDRFGLPPMSEEDVNIVHMSTADDSVRHIFHGSPFLEQAQAYRMQLDFRPFIREMIMEPGLKDLLRQLKPLVGLAVATNRSNTIDKVLAWHGLDGFFDLVVSSLDVVHPKPHPECLLNILGFFGLQPGEALYVGDSVIDEETAQRAGVPFAAYRNPRLRALYHVDRLEEIAGIVKETGPGDKRS